MDKKQLLRIESVTEKTTLSKATIYRKVKAGTFPKPTRLSHRVAVWSLSAIEAWMGHAVGK